jgi:methionine synthase II (cobalamin-independent)
VAEPLPRDRRIASESAAIAAVPIEPVGSIPGPPSPIEVGQGFRPGRISQAEQLSSYDFTVQEAIVRLEVTGSKVVTDGE